MSSIFGGDIMNINNTYCRKLGERYKLPEGLMNVNVRVQDYEQRVFEQSNTFGQNLSLNLLKDYVLPENLEILAGFLMIVNCKNLSLPDNLKEIRGKLHMVDLKDFSLSKSIRSIGGDIFIERCQNISISENLIEIGGNLIIAYSKNIKLPKNVREIVRGKIIQF
jgi:hypothetical protein